MTLYLTDRTDPAEVDRAKASGFVHGFKLYPAGATTNSDSGVTDIAQHLRRARAHERAGRRTPGAWRSHEPRRRRVRSRSALHRDGARAARRSASRSCGSSSSTSRRSRPLRSFAARARELAATITPQHLLLNRNALFTGGIRPHHYCLPVLKTEPDRVALVEAAISGDRVSFWARTARLTLVIQKRLPAAAQVYSPPTRRSSCTRRRSTPSAHSTGSKVSRRNSAPTFTACRATRKGSSSTSDPWAVPEHYPFGPDVLVPMRAGERIGWRLAE